MGLSHVRKMRGVVLWEALLLVTVYAVLVGGAQLAVTKYWNHRLARLQGTRLIYDGVPQWTPNAF